MQFDFIIDINLLLKIKGWYDCLVYFQGNVSSYLTEKYNFSSECKVIAFTGDNPGINF